MSLYLYDKFLEYIGHEWYGEGDDRDAAKAVLDARIAQAETAVRFANSAARCRRFMVDNVEHENELRDAFIAYEAAREAVRKLEGQADGS